MGCWQARHGSWVRFIFCTSLFWGARVYRLSLPLSRLLRQPSPRKYLRPGERQLAQASVVCGERHENLRTRNPGQIRFVRVSPEHPGSRLPHTPPMWGRSAREHADRERRCAGSRCRSSHRRRSDGGEEPVGDMVGAVRLARGEEERGRSISVVDFVPVDGHPFCQRLVGEE
jgi:hypothetical protein